MGTGIIGGELDFGYSPSFFGDKTLFGDNTVIDVMANLIVGDSDRRPARRGHPSVCHGWRWPAPHAD